MISYQGCLFVLFKSYREAIAMGIDNWFKYLSSGFRDKAADDYVINGINSPFTNWNSRTLEGYRDPSLPTVNEAKTLSAMVRRGATKDEVKDAAAFLAAKRALDGGD